ncbi:hypothetical protein MAF45_05495 [Mesosutterella sp. OilRF-GAM-744-9]|uniref:Uncharacterized protein n=1 Tax=Mesosutterella porci TaxID=2915351 RepID=A0ABS9MQJ4_9BURK|nr:hypothetical protein [Mesosutterella sp. oilRF-744-WT-GAM-9]MCG5030898.1 hypothetical protein [Mesosutterella sp. oilRF-744-WT-GAM-9]
MRHSRRLDCYDTILPTFYAAHGFRHVARLKFDPKYAPADWDYSFFSGKADVSDGKGGTKKSKNFNDGKPDIIFMVYDKDSNGFSSQLEDLPETDGANYGEPYVSDAVKK